MSELVLLHHNEPMTTPLALAEGTENTHESAIKLVRKYVEQLTSFGEVGFQIRLNPQGSPTEFAYLNEPQSTLLITFLRNSDVVVRFKVALVKAFYEMRDRLRGNQQPKFLTSNLSHGADLAVAADRTFRSFLRAARSAGMRLPMALRVANRQTLERTGMNMLAELAVDPDAAVQVAAEPEFTDPMALSISAWFENAGPGPWSMKEILAAAAGIKPGQSAYDSATVRAARCLRAHGLAPRKVYRGLRQARMWYRPGSWWGVAAVNPEKEA